jgi:uncharacterized membrane protein
MVTKGISPKAILAAVLPTLGGLVAVAVQWGVTGNLDRAELVTAVGAVVASLLAFAGAWAGSPGDVVSGVPPYRGTERGQVEPLTLLIYVIVAAILIVLLLKVLDRV